MTNLKVTYFDFAGSRGEEVRLALCIAGQAFDDNRVNSDGFAAIKPDLPFASLPVFEMEGRGIFAQSNAILRLIGRLNGLHPEDPYEAARHDALMEVAEELRQKIAATFSIAEPALKKAARQKLSTDYIPQWGRCVDRWIGDGPFVAGAKPSVADIKIYMVDKWISSGGLDDIPADLLDLNLKLKALARGIATLPAVAAWYARP